MSERRTNIDQLIEKYINTPEKKIIFLGETVKALKEQIEDARLALENIREIYAGMDGFIPETCPEGYQQRIIKQMYDEAVSAIAKLKGE